MAFNLQVCSDDLSINFNAKYQNMSNYKKPEIQAIVNREGTPVEVKERTVFQDQVLGPGSTQRKWVDDQGNVYSKQEITFYYEGEEVQENRQTKVFRVESFEGLQNYTDFFIIDKYYELFPSNNGMKKDFDREIAIKANAGQMYKLWEYLTANDVCARGEFCTSSRGFVASDGYIRPISIEGKWGLEIGVFKEKKIFQHLQEGKPEEIQRVAQSGGRKRLKLV